MDDSELNEHAILDWVNTFELENQIANLADLNDGNVLAKILNEISPESFDVDALNKETNGNWALAAGNLRKLLRMLEEYFTEVLQKKIDMSNVDVNSIAKTNDIDSLLNLLELVVGAAVLCEDKAKFIGNIFQLNHNSQSVLKGLIEQVLNRAEDLGGEDDGDEEGLEEYEVEGAGAGGVSAESASSGQQLSEDEAVRNNEMLTHLQAERQRLLTEVAALQTANEGYKAEVSKLREKVIVKDSERSALEGSDRHALQQLETNHNRMAVELDEVKRELDIKISEHHTLTSELKLSSMRLEASKELQAKLEMETHQLADELDIARDKASKLAKAEQTIEKYSKKLEEMVTLKKQNKDLNDKLDTYLDQIHDLESANKGLATMNRMVESYKNKAVELEREKFEAISSAQMKEFAVTQLQSELDALQQSKQFLEDELTSVKNNLQQVLDAQEELKASPVRNRTASQAAAEGSSDIYETDTIPSLKEKVRKLERQLSQQQGGNGSGDADAGSESAGDIALLTEELADANRIRKEREEALFAAKRQVTEAQQEIVKLQRQMADNEKHSSAAVSLKEATQKLGETSNTVRLLEERLKEKETLINKLEQDKGKLESYTKRSLATFKEKYMAVLQQMKEEKKDLENKVRICLEKSEANQVNWHREERLVSSAMFEIGVRIMDRKIQSNLNDNIHATAAANSNNATFMSVQREAQNKTNPADPSLAAAGAGVERKLFPAAGPNSPL